MNPTPAILAAGLTLAPAISNAATIDDWNKLNVIVGPAVVEPDVGASLVYDAPLPDPSAQTYGEIVYAAPEADTPGLRVSNTAYTTGQGSYDGCLLASSTADCDSDFQSGKRFKEHLTSVGSVDLVFDVTPDNEDKTYQVFQRLVNRTGDGLGGFTIELGFGVGDGFAASTAGDGIGISLTAELGPNDLPAFSQYPFGLFGDDAQPNPNPLFTLDGFFQGDGRSGFDVSVSEDKIESGAFYGDYGSLFGSWLSQEDVPNGLLWDYALGLADPLVMAWDNGLGWEVRRGIDDTLDGIIGNLSVNDVYALNQADWQLFDYADVASAESFLLGTPLFEDAIEDLANLNVSYALDLGSNFTGNSFTMRVTSSAAAAAVPLPAGSLLLMTGLGGLALSRRRTRSA